MLIDGILYMDIDPRCSMVLVDLPWVICGVNVDKCMGVLGWDF